MNVLVLCCLRSLIPLALIALFFCPSLVAQDMAPEKKAVLCFDFQLDRLMESELGQSLIESGKINQEDWTLSAPPNKFKRIFGLMGTPGSFAEVAAMGPGNRPIPFEFIYQIEFTDVVAADKLINDMGLDLDDSSELNGLTLYRMPASPQNLFAGKKNEATVIIGTTGYLSSKSKQSLFSPTLQQAWGRQNDAPIRVSFELISRADFFQELIELSGQPPFQELTPVIELLGKFESVNLSFDPEADEMISLRSFANFGQANELREGLSNLAGIAKIYGNGFAAQVEPETPNIANVITSAVGDLNVVGEEREVNIIIGKPESMSAAIKEINTVEVR